MLALTYNQGTHQGAQRKESGVVERRNNQHRSFGLRLRSRLQRERADTELHLLRRRPLLHVVVYVQQVAICSCQIEADRTGGACDEHQLQNHMRRVEDDSHDVQFCLNIWPSEVLLQRLLEMLLVILQKIGYLRDLLLAERDRASPSGPKGGAGAIADLDSSGLL